MLFRISIMFFWLQVKESGYHEYEKENLVSLVLVGERSLSTTDYCFFWYFNKNFYKILSFEDMRPIEYKRELLNIEQRKIQIS